MNFLYDKNVRTGLILKCPSYNTLSTLWKAWGSFHRKEIFTQDSLTNKLWRLPFCIRFKHASVKLVHCQRKSGLPFHFTHPSFFFPHPLEDVFMIGQVT